MKKEKKNRNYAAIRKKFLKSKKQEKKGIF